MDNAKPGYFAVIPAAVRYDDRLPANAKLLYGEISALSNKNGACCATNAYFAELYQTTERTVSRLVSKLEEFGHIQITSSVNPETKEKQRSIVLTMSLPDGQGVDNFVYPPRQNCQGEVDKIVYHNNNINNNNGNEEKAGRKPRTVRMTPDQVAQSFESWCKGLSCVTEAQAASLCLNLARFVQRRSEIGKPFSSSLAVSNLQSRLLRLSGGSYDAMIEMLEKAIDKGWETVYAPSSRSGSRSAGLGSAPSCGVDAI